jgi:hypothetical protein
LHNLHAFTPDGTALGTLYQENWTRADGESNATHPKRYKSLPFEQKETYRWLTTLQQAQAAAAEMPQTAVVAVADSEADIYEVLAAGQDRPRRLDWIVRAAQDRATLGKPAEMPEDPAKSRLRGQVLATPVVATQTVRVRGRTAKIACEDRGRRQSRESRQAAMEVRATIVTLSPPHRKGGRLPVIDVNAVLVSEPAPPAGEPAVEWLLLTSLPIETADQVRRAIQLYGVRWMIEVFFRTLKSGCRVEARRFEQVDRFRTCLAVYMIVAWRTLFACRLGREFPEMTCEAIFEPAEWKAAYRVVKRADPPAQPPRLKEMIRIVAQLGGYVYRKRTDEPGPQTVGRGLQRLHDFALCWNLFGPGAEDKDV